MTARLPTAVGTDLVILIKSDAFMKPLLIVLMFVVFIALLGVGVIAPVLAVFTTSLGATGVTLGLIMATFPFTRGLMLPVVGGLSDRKGRKLFMLVGLGVYAVAGLLFTFAGSVLHLIPIRVLQGVGSSMTVPMAMAYTGDMAPEGHEGRYIGYLNLANLIGFGSGPVLGGVLRDLWGVDSVFYGMGAFSILALILVLFFVPSQQAEVVTRIQERLLVTFRRMSGNPKVLGVLLSRTATMMVMMPTMAFLPILMTRRMDASGLEIGIAIGTRTIVSALLQAPFGSLTDRSNKIVLLALGSSVVGVTMFLVPVARSFSDLIVLLVFMGTGEALVWPVLGAFAIEEGRRYGQGSMMGVFNMSMSAGVFLSSLMAGFSMDLYGLGFAFYSIAIIIVVSAVAASWLIARGQSRHPAVP
jgi:MFS family permease